MVQSFELDYNRPFTFWYHKPSKASGYATLSRALTVEETKISGKVIVCHCHGAEYMINPSRIYMSMKSRVRLMFCPLMLSLLETMLYTSRMAV